LVMRFIDVSPVWDNGGVLLLLLRTGSAPRH